MKLQQMRFVVAIADNQLNVSNAAKALYTSQPGISRQLRLMEEELDLVIYKRKGKLITGITEQGEYVLAGFREVLNKVGEIKHLSKSIALEQEKIKATNHEQYYAIAV
jgi:LysR family cys regulon transcriptional activator